MIEATLVKDLEKEEQNEKRNDYYVLTIKQGTQEIVIGFDDFEVVDMLMTDIIKYSRNAISCEIGKVVFANE